MNHIWSTLIDKLMFWRESSWVKYPTTSCRLVLRIHCDQLLITEDSTVVESLNMNWKIKGIFKEDILILIISPAGKEVRKLKFQIICNVSKYLQKLAIHFPIVNYHSMHSEIFMSSKYRRIEDVLQQAIEEKGMNVPLHLPPAYYNFVKLCLLDPLFPKIVHETGSIIHETILKKKKTFHKN